MDVHFFFFLKKTALNRILKTKQNKTRYFFFFFCWGLLPPQPRARPGISLSAMSSSGMGKARLGEAHRFIFPPSYSLRPLKTAIKRNKLCGRRWQRPDWDSLPVRGSHGADKSGLLRDTLHFTTWPREQEVDQINISLTSRRRRRRTAAAMPVFFRLIPIRFIVVLFFCSTSGQEI